MATPPLSPNITPKKLTVKVPAGTLKFEAESGVKLCPSCSKESGYPVAYPATTEFFYRNTGRGDLLGPYCIRCTRTKSSGRPGLAFPLRIRALSDPTPLDRPESNSKLPGGYAQCANPYCGRVRPMTSKFFGPDPDMPMGYSTLCRRCDHVRQQYDLQYSPVPISVPRTKQVSGDRTDKSHNVSPVCQEQEAMWEAQFQAEHANQPGFGPDGLPY